jgi:hypothetical protein
LQGGVNIIIEDGLRIFEANVAFLEEALNRRRSGGIYVRREVPSVNNSLKVRGSLRRIS